MCVRARRRGVVARVEAAVSVSGIGPQAGTHAGMSIRRRIGSVC